ncbi:UNVERIFIED_CONTAM: Transposon Ty3-G Gag-Pol polyprotein [Sesamum latifolium]|uniref:Transposon Ty3-G Gag-Pol polyprotein n=1 Tax=Sesamum latifolium TaxID=2727402 RepID=A0AAW2VGB4_9LAMI
MLEKVRGTGLYQKQEGDKAKEMKAASPERFPKEGAKYASGNKGEINDPPRKGVIRMIVEGPVGGDSHHGRKWQVREAHDISLKEVLDVEAMEDAPLIQFGRAERSGPKISHNDALVITDLLANYEVGRIFIDFGSSADILFEEAYDQMQLGDNSLEKVNTSLYGFAGEVVHPRGMVSLPLTLGAGVARRTCMLKFLVVDVPSAYNVILGRPTLNAFQAVISTYRIKIKISTPSEVGKVQGDPLQSRKCYVETVRKGQKRTSDEAHKGGALAKKGKDLYMEEVLEETGKPAKVQPVEELLNIEIIPGNPNKITRIGSQMSEETKKEVVQCLQHPSFKPVKQKKRHFGPEKDKIIQAEVDKLMVAGHIKEIQFPEWLSNVVLVPKPEGKWRMCIDFRDLNKACPKDFYPLPRIDQLVDSTSGYELLSMMDAHKDTIR